VCSEARGGACVRYKEEHSVDGERRGTQGSRTNDSTKEGKRAKAAATCTEDKSTQTTGKCNTCGVRIGDSEYCAKCSLTTDHLVDGVCTATDTESACTPKDSADGICKSCARNYFLFQGGCYKVGQEPGSLVCTDALGSNTDKPGVCKACAEGYFRNTQADSDSTQDSCKACQDANCATCQDASAAGKCTKCAEGYFVGAANSDPGACVACGDASGSTWKGVTGCAKCTKPKTAGAATCTECQTDKYLKTETTGATSCVASNECTGGFFPMTDTADSNKKKCLACSDGTNGIANCAECTAPAQGKTKPTCTKCSGDNYLKTVDGTTTCVAKDACKDDFFPVDDSTNGHKCVSCGDEAAGVPNCVKCTLSSGVTKPTCSECSSGYKLEGEACVPASASSSANLGTGAIAGISVAAVVVVGGLVGFLCWWFICRGKA
ncbi:Variant-specific surface protein, partial [Giardia duodenalis]